MDDCSELLLVLGEGPGLVGHHGKVGPLAGSRSDEPGVGSDSEHTQIVARSEDTERSVLDLT